jgi:hypothetical protein
MGRRTAVGTSFRADAIERHGRFRFFESVDSVLWIPLNFRSPRDHKLNRHFFRSTPQLSVANKHLRQAPEPHPELRLLPRYYTQYDKYL